MKNAKKVTINDVYLDVIERLLNEMTENPKDVVEFFIECIKSESKDKLQCIIDDILKDLSSGQEVKLVPIDMSAEEFNSMSTEEVEKLTSEYVV